MTKPNEAGSLTIGKVARLCGIGVETVRFYEREGLIEEPPRRESGYRQFSEDVVSRLHLIKRARELGFSLKSIKELLYLRADGSMTCAEVRQQAESKVAEIDKMIKDLTRMKGALEEVATSCRESGPSSECPFLEALLIQEE